MKGNNKISKGMLLISAPFLSDVFKRSVILMTEHNEEGSVGFIINKSTDYKLHDVVEDFPEFDAKIYIGGPVQQNALNFIHRSNGLREGGVEISEGIFWGGNFEMLKLLIQSGSLNPDDFKFFLGYSGWSPDQLYNEIKQNSWYLNKPTVDNVFDNDVSKLWSRILKKMGNEYSIISTFPEDPSVN